MKLNEILELNYSIRKDRTKKTCISEIYGIIYRIYCIPEDKSYVGQTFSHSIASDNFCRHGIINRCKIHMRYKDYDDHKNRPLYKALNTYPTDQFEIFEELKIYGKDIGLMNQIEGEYMKKYNSVYPYGYNVEEVGKKYTKLLKLLEEHYQFETKDNVYVDKTREDRCKDICFGKRFDLQKKSYTRDLILEKLRTINIQSARLVETTGGLRIILKETGKRDNIRVYFKGSREECLEFTKRITDNIEVSESVRGEDCYKYQTKLENVLSFSEITKVSGKAYKNKSSGAETYLLIFYGKKNNKIQSLSRISFGGKKVNIEESKGDAMSFIDHVKMERENIEIILN